MMVFILILLINHVTSELPICQSTSVDNKAKLCTNYANYSKIQYPSIPCFIDTKLTVQDIIKVDESDQLIELLLMNQMHWTDSRIGLILNNETKPSSYPWYLVIDDEFNEIWKPYFKYFNAIDSKKGAAVSNTLWYKDPGEFYYEHDFLLTISCEMEFGAFPFDHHACFLRFFNRIGTDQQVVLNKPVVVFDEKSDGYHGNAKRLRFEVEMEALPTTLFERNVGSSYKYSQVNVKIILRRKSREIFGLFSTFYFPTLIFSILSLVSYAIPIDSVPGRIMLLITLYLVMFNTYISVEAPKSRGFSHLDVWAIGIQIPIIVAILEYGLLLSISKYGFRKMFGKTVNFHALDTLTLVVSVAYICVFSSAYWLISLSLEA